MDLKNSMLLANMMSQKVEEMPLTVVGTPTINDGVVSGFSSGDYIRTTNSFNFSQITNYEILIKCKGYGYPICLGQGGSGTWKIWVTTNGEIFFTTSAHTERMSISGLSVDTEYYIRVKYNNSTAILGYSTDNINYTETSQNFTGLSTAKSVINIGYNQNYGGFWNGSIDLNSSYIVINGTKYILTLP